MKYLVALDGWDPSSHALEFALDQAAAAGADVEVAYVADDDGDPDVPEQIRREATAAGEQVDVAVTFNCLRTEKSVRPAAAVGRCLLDYARREGHDAVFVGNDDTGAAKQAIVGTVSGTLIEARELPVVLVP